MKKNIPTWHSNATGSDYANIQQPLDIANALQDSPIRLLLEAGVSEFTIQTLAQTFWVEYLEHNHQRMITRWDNSKKLIDDIHMQDSGRTSPFDKIIVTDWFMQEPFNKQLKEHNVDKLPFISKTNDVILIDLFSQWRVDLLPIKLDEHPRNAAISKEHSINEYLFNPTQVLYVDLHNDDWQKTCTREGDSKAITQSYVKSDALQFVSLLPDNSVCYLISGFDDYVIKSYMPLGAKYLEALNQQLLRTTKSQGVILWVNYERRDILKKLDFTTLFEKEERDDGFYCHQKP